MKAKRKAIGLAEALRTPQTVMEIDPRNSAGEFFAVSLEQRYANIEAMKLNISVPDAVAIQFDTARNLYLYAWYVYRFHMVAAKQAYAALELALRLALPERLPAPYQHSRSREPMLKGLLDYAIDQGLLRNEGFQRWHNAAAVKAEQRRFGEILKMTLALDLEHFETDDSEQLLITHEDEDWNLLQTLSETMPALRNTLAHGSTMLTSNVLGTIELVAEILNQLYPLDQTTG